MRDLVQEIKDSVDIVSVIGRYVSLTTKGNKYWGLSPFKTEKTPSFTVDSEKKFYYCFSTSQGGDVFKFVQDVENTDFMGAVRIIARDMGIDIDAYSSSNENYVDDGRARLLELCRRIDKTFTYLLYQPEGERALSYMKLRGFDDEILKKFHIGYAKENAKWLYNFLNTKGYTDNELKESGLFSRNYDKYPLFRDRVMFPIMSVSGQVLGFGGRLLSGEGPKYINSPETRFYKKKSSLYGLYQATQDKAFSKLKKAYLVEGYLDVMALHQAGITSAVAPLGTAFTEIQAIALRRVTDSVVFLFDDDDAGFTASIKSAIICEKVGFKSIKIIALSENDPADVLQNFGSSELREQVVDEIDFFDFYMKKIYPKPDASIQEKEAIIVQVLEYVYHVQSDYQKASYISIIADIFSVTKELIVQLLNENEQKFFARDRSIENQQKNLFSDNSNVENNERPSQDDNKYPLVKNGELLTFAALCSLLVVKNDFYEQFRHSVKYKDIDDIHARKIFTILEDAYRNGTISMDEVLSKMDTSLSTFIQELMASGEASLHAEKIIDDYLLNLKIKRLKKRGKEIEYQLRVLSSGNTLESKLKSHRHSNKDASVLDSSQELESQLMSSHYENNMNDLLMEKKFITGEVMRLMNEKNKSS